MTASCRVTSRSCRPQAPRHDGAASRRLEESGVITGYHARVDLDRIGLPITAFIRLKYPSGDYRPLHKAVAERVEVLECHHVTGDDCFLFKVAARSMRHLEEVSGHLAELGGTTTSIVFSAPLERRVVSGPPASKPPRQRRR